MAPIPFNKHCFHTYWVGLVSEGCTEEGDEVVLEKKARRLSLEEVTLNLNIEGQAAFLRVAPESQSSGGER